MAFYSPDRAMSETLGQLVARLEAAGRPGLREQLSITWLLVDRSLSGEVDRSLPLRGASHGGDVLRYPASVIKLVYLVAAEAWLQRGWLREEPELRRALAAMIQDSSNDATGYVVDRLSGTTSGPELRPPEAAAWESQRQLVNGWLASLQWPELRGCNACQKTWGDGPFGRERIFYGERLENRNRLSTDATARLLHGVMTSTLVSPPAGLRMQALLRRSLDPGGRVLDPENQVDGFLGEGVPVESRLWSKAGWMSQARHDAAYIAPPPGTPFLVVVMSAGAAAAADTTLLPAIARSVLQACGGSAP
ncbi:MAG: serine hydrolase [Cyanobacteriota bacterium]